MESPEPWFPKKKAKWFADPTGNRPLYEKPCPVPPKPRPNKPYLFDVSDIEGTTQMPKGSSKVYKVTRCCNPLEPVYPWKFDGEQRAVPEARICPNPSSNQHNRTLNITDIDGAMTSKVYTRQVAKDPLDYSDVPGSTVRPPKGYEPRTSPRPSKTLRLGHWTTMGDSGRFTRTSRAPTDPNNPVYSIHGREVKRDERVSKPIVRNTVKTDSQRRSCSEVVELGIVDSMEKLKSNNLNVQSAKKRYEPQGVKFLHQVKPMQGTV